LKEYTILDVIEKTNAKILKLSNNIKMTLCEIKKIIIFDLDKSMATVMELKFLNA
jgi:DNA-directed RNA polymerase alpha subunit